MASDFLKLDPSRTLGQSTLNLRDHIQAAINISTELSGEFGHSIADDPTGTALATQLGNGLSAADALAIRGLVGSVYTDITNAGNVFVGFASRINRNF